MAEIYYIEYIEDDKSISDIVAEYLARKGCTAAVFSTITQAKVTLERHTPDLVLVDWNMPDGEGTVLCRWIRDNWEELPLIFLTVRNDSGDIVSGFDSGADDYVAKPFELEVLYSRIKALLRRAGTAGRCGLVSIDKNGMTVQYQGKEVMLSQTEYQLLAILMENEGKTVTRERLLARIWDQNGNYVNDNTLTITMKRLREKLRQLRCLKTVRSFGYRMEEEE